MLSEVPLLRVRLKYPESPLGVRPRRSWWPPVGERVLQRFGVTLLDREQVALLHRAVLAERSLVAVAFRQLHQRHRDTQREILDSGQPPVIRFSSRPVRPLRARRVGDDFP